MPPEPVDDPAETLGARHRTLRLRVADELHSMITTGQLRPGERLIEDQLAAALGVSRNPVREAIRLLESTGLVEVRPRRGSYVASIDIDDLQQLLAVRALLEGRAAELAAQNATPDDAARVRAWVEAGREATEAGDVLRAAECHRGFHTEVERLAGNRYLAEVARPLLNRTELVFSLLLERRGQATWVEHDAIATAIEAGDGAAAKATVETHLQHVAESLQGHEDLASSTAAPAAAT